MAQKKNTAQQQSARERLRHQQQEAAAKEKRMKVAIRSLVGVAVLVVVAVVAAIALNQGGTSSATPTTVTEQGGIVLDPGEAGADGATTTGDDTGATAGDVPQVSVYLDYQCPHCLAFEQANLPFLSEQLAAGAISVAVHPVALMDNASQGTDFSSRAANAAVCVAEHQPDAFLDVNQGLFDLQGAAAAGSVDDEVLTDAVAAAGADTSQVRSCILDRDYDGGSATPPTGRCPTTPWPGRPVASGRPRCWLTASGSTATQRTRARWPRSSSSKAEPWRTAAGPRVLRGWGPGEGVRDLYEEPGRVCETSTKSRGGCARPLSFYGASSARSIAA